MFSLCGCFFFFFTSSSRVSGEGVVGARGNLEVGEALQHQLAIHPDGHSKTIFIPECAL